jgi:hypothetical protein
VPGAHPKATGKEWTSSAPILVASSKNKKQKNGGGMRTPSGGTIRHDSDEEEPSGPVPADFFDGGAGASGSSGTAQEGEDAALPEGFFDDPVQDAKARGIEYKVNELGKVPVLFPYHTGQCSGYWVS